MTWRKRNLNVDEEISKAFKKIATSFKNFINHLLLILFYFYSPFFHLPLLYYLTRCILGIFLLPLNGDSFVTILRVIAQFGGWFQQCIFFCIFYIYIYIYISMYILHILGYIYIYFCLTAADKSNQLMHKQIR